MVVGVEMQCLLFGTFLEAGERLHVKLLILIVGVIIEILP